MALLQGLVICGTCGERMSVRYHSAKRRELNRFYARKVKIFEGAETMGDILTRRTAAGQRYTRVTLMLLPFGLVFLDSASSPHTVIGIQADRVFYHKGRRAFRKLDRSGPPLYDKPT
jgi:hypothetical protein